ncbi:hypothetical protein Ocin01_19000 [Orchesella cincta]|uniref:Uncharacterized protein n=1 Tax=Orchesella cincta TaxID=48709 RepID=A0A1D2M436_ORCCI|nr:hypothetical protein Ocin01_19000 [Orchesella cincta]
MQKFTIVILVVASFAAYSSAVRPQSKLYFSSQLLGMLLTGLFGNTLPSQQTGATGAQLHIVPLGQALGMMFTGLFGGGGLFG